MELSNDINLPTEHEIRSIVWRSKMENICETARFFSRLDVIDIGFENSPAMWEVYVAYRPDDRARGLANIEASHLDTDGMLFSYYSSPSYAPFSVAEMLFDLHIAWYDLYGAQIKRQEALAGSSQPIYAPSAYNYVLESANPIPQGNLRLRHA